MRKRECQQSPFTARKRLDTTHLMKNLTRLPSEDTGMIPLRSPSLVLFSTSTTSSSYTTSTKASKKLSSDYRTSSPAKSSIHQLVTKTTTSSNGQHFGQSAVAYRTPGWISITYLARNRCESILLRIQLQVSCLIEDIVADNRAEWFIRC
jgi:hypothetical protein